MWLSGRRRQRPLQHRHRLNRAGPLRAGAAAGRDPTVARACRFISDSANRVATSRSAELRAVDIAHGVGVVGIPRDGGRPTGRWPGSDSASAFDEQRVLDGRGAVQGTHARIADLGARPSRSTPRGRPGRKPPTACCSSARSHTRFPSGRTKTRGRARPRARSSGSPPRGGTRSSRRARGRTTSGRSSTPSTSRACRCEIEVGLHRCRSLAFYRFPESCDASRTAAAI